MTKWPEAIATDQAMAEKKVQSSLRFRGAMPAIYALKVTGMPKITRVRSTVANSAANLMDITALNGRVTNTWKAKLWSGNSTAA